jgi:hypothetical protein
LDVGFFLAELTRSASIRATCSKRNALGVVRKGICACQKLQNLAKIEPIEHARSVPLF